MFCLLWTIRTILHTLFNSKTFYLRMTVTQHVLLYFFLITVTSSGFYHYTTIPNYLTYLYGTSVWACEFKKYLTLLTVTYCFKLAFLTSKLELNSRSPVLTGRSSRWLLPLRFSSHQAMKRNSTFNPFPSRVSTAHLCFLLSSAYSWISKLRTHDR